MIFQAIGTLTGGGLVETLGKISVATYYRMLEIIKSPYIHSEMMWIITPILISIFLISFYFGRYKKEELGWNTAFGNSMILIFASVDLLRHQYAEGVLFDFNVQNVLIAAIIIQGVLLTFLNFFHLLPKSFAFGLSSGPTINVIIIFIILLIYANIPIDLITALATAILAGVFIGFIEIIQWIEPSGDDDEDDEE